MPRPRQARPAPCSSQDPLMSARIEACRATCRQPPGAVYDYIWLTPTTTTESTCDRLRKKGLLNRAAAASYDGKLADETAHLPPLKPSATTSSPSSSVSWRCRATLRLHSRRRTSLPDHSKKIAIADMQNQCASRSRLRKQRLLETIMSHNKVDHCTAHKEGWGTTR